ncbi:MAG: hypothetical protein ALECFALPRED_005353 [Alectoria fallacina]|uniref:Uncharacterized protein n=1 Tax=Alectoria fallacina TaxID=1903189 RepID=A0A8H3IUE8_9LECA|nr:MAG: hypothetical protein ALECFALPRED_005353 [Alectoria fallacina]
MPSSRKLRSWSRVSGFTRFYTKTSVSSTSACGHRAAAVRAPISAECEEKERNRLAENAGNGTTASSDHGLFYEKAFNLAAGLNQHLALWRREEDLEADDQAHKAKDVQSFAS